MATNTLNDRSVGETIEAEFFNSIHQALEDDVVGRDSSGVPAAGKNLGTAAFPWGTVRSDAIIVNGSALDISQVAAPPSRVVSGATRSTSNQPAYLTPDGGAATLNILGGTTSLVYDVNGVAVTLSSDIQETGLTLAPSTNNTCLINDTDAADQDDTRLWGEENPFATKKEIQIDTIGTEISSRNGKLAAFQHGTGEIFLARIDTTNTRLHKCFRGFFYDSAVAPIKREVFSNNDQLVILNLGFVFLEDNATTIDVTYNEPVYSFTAPGSPATGDYWFDLGNNLWNRYSGTQFENVDRTFVGLIVMDDTNAIAARSEDFNSSFKDDNTLALEIQSTEIVRAKALGSKVNVYGSEIFYGNSQPSWNMTTNLATSADMYNASEAANTYYYLYVKNDGNVVISDIEPHDRKDLKGLYHPQNPWRMVGGAFNDNSNDIVRAGDEISDPGKVYAHTTPGTGAVATRVLRLDTLQEDSDVWLEFSNSTNDAAAVKIKRDGKYAGHYASKSTVSEAFRIGLNVSNKTTGASSLPVAERFGGQNGENRGAANLSRSSISGTQYLQAGDELVPSSDGGATTSDDDVTFVVQRLV